jgi:hypothetical protein
MPDREKPAEDNHANAETGLHPKPNERTTHRVHALAKHSLEVVWHQARRHPFLAAVVGGVSVVGVGALVGVTELAISVVAVYGVLEVFKGREKRPELPDAPVLKAGK